MNLSRIILAASVAVFLFMMVGAQTPRRPGTNRSGAKPSPTATPAPAAASPTPAADPASPVLATIGDINISTADIEADVSAAIMRDSDPYLRDFYALVPIIGGQVSIETQVGERELFKYETRAHIQ